jgi:long-chain fatty acid transport protein
MAGIQPQQLFGREDASLSKRSHELIGMPQLAYALCLRLDRPSVGSISSMAPSLAVQRRVWDNGNIAALDGSVDIPLPSPRVKVRIFSQHTLVSSVLLVLLHAAVPMAYATEGYWPYGFGTVSKGTAGVNVALALDAMAPASNPAALVDVGTRFDGGIAILYPPRGYTIGPGGLFVPHSERSGDNVFLGPSAGYNRQLSEDWAVGFALYGAGLNTNYPASAGNGLGTFLSGRTGADVRQFFLSPAVAYRINQLLSVGVAPIFSIQRGRVNGFGTFSPFSNNLAALTNRNFDYAVGGGARVGAQFQLSPQVAVGGSYQSRIYTTDFARYAGLLPKGGNFSAPANAALGIAYKFSQRDFVSIEVERIFYKDVPALGNSIDNLLTGCAAAGGVGTAGCFGGANGPGLGWKNMTVLKLGGQWAPSDSVALRVGYNIANKQIRPAEIGLNIVGPAVVRQHITAGSTVSLWPGQDLNLSLSYAPRAQVSGVAPSLFGAHPVTLTSCQFEAELGWTYRF